MMGSDEEDIYEKSLRDHQGKSIRILPMEITISEPAVLS